MVDNSHVLDRDLPKFDDMNDGTCKMEARYHLEMRGCEGSSSYERPNKEEEEEKEAIKMKRERR